MEYIPKRSNILGTVLSLAFLILGIGSLVLSSFVTSYKYLFFLITVFSVLLSIFILIRYTVSIYRYTIEKRQGNYYVDSSAMSLDFVVWKRFGDNPYKEEARLGINSFIDIILKENKTKEDENVNYRTYNYCPSFAPKKMAQLLFDDGDSIVAINVELNDELIEYFSELKKTMK